MRLNKEQREEKERKWQIDNDLPNAVCEGKFYIWNKSYDEVCKYRDKCPKYLELKKQRDEGQIWFSNPTVKFYYVDAFRKCKFRKEKEE